MIQWPMQRHVYTVISSNNAMNKSLVHYPSMETTVKPHPVRMSSTGVSPSPSLPDDSLTNLSWLHDMHILKRAMPSINTPAAANVSSSDPSTSLANVYPNDIDDSNDVNINNDEQWRMYRSNPQAKPVYSYSQLILLALKQSGHEKMTLQMIYEWVAENFPYFKKMEPTWQNSIRHNLSLNKCFMKIARTKKETGGKGGFWKLSPEYERQRCPPTISSLNPLSQHNPSTSNKRLRPSKRSLPSSEYVKPLLKNVSRTTSLNHAIKAEAWIDPVLPSLHCHTSANNYVRMPSSLLSPISSPDSLPVPSFHHHPQAIGEFHSVLTPSPSNSPSSMSSAKQNFLPTKLDEADMLLLDSASFDWDAYLCEAANDLDVHPLLCTKTEQDLFNEFNAALTDLTSSAEAAAGGDASAFDGFDYPLRQSTFHALFEDDEQQASLTIKGRGIKRPAWWLTNDTTPATKLPSLETAFDLKLSK